MDAPSPWCRRVREERTRSALAPIGSRYPGPHSRQSGLCGARQRSGYRRLHQCASSAQPERAMPPAPDSSTALHMERALGAQLASLHSSPRPRSRGRDPRRSKPAAGLASWRQRAWTDPVTPSSEQRARRRLLTCAPWPAACVRRAIQSGTYAADHCRRRRCRGAATCGAPTWLRPGRPVRRRV